MWMGVNVGGLSIRRYLLHTKSVVLCLQMLASTIIKIKKGALKATKLNYSSKTTLDCVVQFQILSLNCKNAEHPLVSKSMQIP